MPKPLSSALLLAGLLLAVGGLAYLALATRAGSPVPTETIDAGGTADASSGTRAEGSRLEAPAHGSLPSPASAAPNVAGRTAVPQSGSASQPHGLALTGRVVDEAGAPLRDAIVACAPASDLEGVLADREGDLDDSARAAAHFRELARQQLQVTTDAEGRFTVGTPDPLTRTQEPVQLRVLARGFVVLERHAARPAPDASPFDLGTLILQRGAIVSGRVLDRAGKPIAEASVSRRSHDEPRIVEQLESAFEAFTEHSMGAAVATDAEGRFELAHVPPGDFALRATHPDHPPGRMEGLNAEAGKDLRDLVLVVEPAATIAGRVAGIPQGSRGVRVLVAPEREHGEKPSGFLGLMLSGATEELGDAGLALGERSAAADAAGAFVLRGLVAGRGYRVWVVQDGPGLAGSAVCSRKVEVSAPTTNLELRYESGAVVTFRVVDARTGAPIERLWIEDRLVGGGGLAGMVALSGIERGRRSRFFPGGTVTVANLRPRKGQTLSLAVEALGFARLERKGIEVPRTGALDLGTLRLEPIPVIRVEVAAAADGQPIAGARVRVLKCPDGSETDRGTLLRSDVSGAAAATTAADGRCTLNAHPGARVLIAVDATAHAPHVSEPVVLPERDDYEHRAALLRGGAVEVKVVDTTGEPIADATVEHRASGGHSGSKQTDARGGAVFERLAPGNHGFRLAGRGSADGGGVTFRMSVNTGDAGPAQAQPASERHFEVVEVTDGERATLRLVKPAAATLSGTVRENGVPLAGARVAFVEGAGANDAPSTEEAMQEMVQEQIGSLMAAFGGDGASARTGKDGSYRLTKLHAGEHRLRVTHRDRAMPATVPVTLRAGDNAFDVELQTISLRGTVRNAAGKPIAGAAVAVLAAPNAEFAEAAMGAMAGMEAMLGGLGHGGSKSSSVKTDAGGRYELRGLRPGHVVVRAQAEGFAPGLSERVEVANGAAREGVDLKLVAAGSARVLVAGEKQYLHVVARYEGDDQKGIAPVIRILRAGSATFEGLRPGRWKFTASAQGQEDSEPRFADVVAGRTVEVTF